MTANHNELHDNVKIYPDTAAGAIDALLYMSVYKPADLGEAIPDPQVMGVWKVKHTAKAFKKHGTLASIVYLAGYPGPWGDKRTSNDFEDIEA